MISVSNRQTGLSLLELLVLIGLLIAVAIYFYPQIEASRQAKRRIHAQEALTHLGNAMAEFKSRHGTYHGAAGSNAEPQGEGTPWIISAEVPGNGAPTSYRLRITFANEYGFEARAVPVGKQIEDPCGTLTLSSTFARGLVNARQGNRRADCWTIPEPAETPTP